MSRALGPWEVEERTGLAPEADGESKEPKTVYGEDSVRCVCPYCGRNVLTDVTHSHTVLSVLFALFLFLILGFIACCVYPFVSQLTQDTKHQCPRCERTIASVSRFKLPAVSKSIVTFRCGSCAVVLSKRYLAIFGLTSLLLASLTSIKWYIREYGLPDVAEGEHIPETWQEYIQLCATRTSLGNPLRATKIFDEKFFGKTVSWSGQLNSVREGFFKKNFIFVNMDPHLQQRINDPDLGLIFNARDFNAKVAEIDPGDLIAFNATLLELGSRNAPHLGILRNLVLTAKVNSADSPDSKWPPQKANNTNYLYKPPIVHVIPMAKKIRDKRNDFVKRMAEEDKDGKKRASADLNGY